MTEYTLSPWSLTDLFPSADGPEIEAAFKEIESKTRDFADIRQKLSDDIDFEEFIDAIKAIEAIRITASKLATYPGLWFAADTQSQQAQVLYARVQQFMAQVQNDTLFFSLWWKELGQEKAEALMSRADDYRYWLEEMRHFKPHTPCMTRSLIATFSKWNWMVKCKK